MIWFFELLGLKTVFSSGVILIIRYRFPVLTHNLNSLLDFDVLSETFAHVYFGLKIITLPPETSFPLTPINIPVPHSDDIVPVMASQVFHETIGRIFKYHGYFSREQDTDLKHAYLSALIEASQELSAQVSPKKSRRERCVFRASTDNCDGYRAKSLWKP